MTGRAKDPYQGLIEAAPDAIIAVESHGRIQFANAQAERLFGYPREELIGEPVEVLVPDASRGTHQALREGYVHDPRPRPMGGGLQLAARRKDGSEFPADISLSAFETADGLVVSVAVRDVTERLAAQAAQERLRAEAERERFEARLHQSQRLESLGQLAGGVAHDFNNLLGAILNYTSFISKAVATAVEESGGDRWKPVLADLHQVERAAERAAELTHQLLTFGRRDVVTPVVVNLNDVVADVEQLLRRTIGEQIQLVIAPSHDLWPVLADPGQLEQVLLNLAVNARDSMVNGGRIDIDTANLVIDSTYADAQPNLEAGRYVRLRLSDTGKGMTPEVRSQAFDPFFTTKAKGDGSGLGLATVHGIVTQSGGHVRIYSEPGLGTTITALLPATELAPAAGPPPRRTAVGDGETILVVEDDEAMREVTRRILLGNGHRVVAAGSGREALEVISSGNHTIQLLLTDVVMPHMLGKELAERVTGLNPAIRVLFMSGYAQPVLASQGTLDAGVTLVEKPFTEQILLAKVREVLDEA